MHETHLQPTMKPSLTLFAGMLVGVLSTTLVAHEVSGGADHGHAEAQRLPDHIHLAAGKLQNRVSITERDGYRYISANNIPEHDTGDGARGRNPNTISEQNKNYRVTLNPTAAAQPTPSFPNAFGVALNGVFFEPSTAEFWNDNRDWNLEAIDARGRRQLGLDEHHAHVQPDGSYDYHGTPTGLIRSEVAKKRTKVLLLGYAADGFPIYGQYGYSDPKNAGSTVTKLKSSWQLKRGRRPDGGPGGRHDGTYTADYEYVEGKGDLDAFNGRFAVTPEYPDGIYHYVITDTFPFVSRSWRGTPDPSFNKRGGQGGPGGQAGPPQGGPGGQGGHPQGGPGGQGGHPPQGGQGGHPQGGPGGHGRPPHGGPPPHGGDRPPHPPRR